MSSLRLLVGAFYLEGLCYLKVLKFASDDSFSGCFLCGDQQIMTAIRRSISEKTSKRTALVISIEAICGGRIQLF